MDDGVDQKQLKMNEVIGVAYRTRDAYSASIWGAQLWVMAAEMLIDMGMTEDEAEEVLRSKMTRWARDAYGSKSTWIGRLHQLVQEDKKAKRGFQP